MFYQVGEHTFHSPISDPEKYPNLKVCDINQLRTDGDDIEDLLSMQFVKKMIEVINSGEYFFEEHTQEWSHQEEELSYEIDAFAFFDLWPRIWECIKNSVYLRLSNSHLNYELTDCECLELRKKHYGKILKKAQKELRGKHPKFIRPKYYSDIQRPKIEIVEKANPLPKSRNELIEVILHDSQYANEQRIRIARARQKENYIAKNWNQWIAWQERRCGKAVSKKSD